MSERPGVTIYRGEYIHVSAKIGAGSKIGAGHDIGWNVKIGENCNIQAHVAISDGWVIGDDVFIGPGVKFFNDKYMDGNITPGIVESKVRIGGHSSIGAGVRLGFNCRVGQHSNVIEDVPHNVWVYGNPAKVRGPVESR